MAELGCLICGAPAEIHHPTGAGMGLRASHYDAIPLCPTHHRTGGYGVAIHAGQKAWEAKFGLQAELTAKVKKLLRRDYSVVNT